MKQAKAYYDREINRLSALDTELGVTKKEMLNNLRSKRAYLDLELATLAPNQYGTYRATIEEYLKANFSKKQAYRGWLNEVETIMQRLGYDKRTINKFFEGFDQLTPAQFVTMYRQNNLISRIYELYIPSREGDFRLSTTEDDAKDLIDTVMQEKDQMIERAKQHEAFMDGTELKEWVNSLNDEHISKGRQPLRKSRKDITKKDIEMIEALGGTIEDLLK